MTADLRFSVLGPMGVRRGPEDLAVGPPQQQAMLAVLLLRRGRAASAADLQDALWEGEPPASALTTVRTYAWRLRRLLEDPAGAPRVLVSLGDGYRLVLPEDAVDLTRAVSLVAHADRARAEGRPGDCGRLLAEALALWTGDPLAGIPGPFAQRQREQLTELRLNLLEQRIEIDLLLGRCATVEPELTALIDGDPLRERPYGQLMRVLEFLGRRADALAVFRDLRQRLVSELGVEPGPELQALHQRILDGDTSPAVTRHTTGTTPAAVLTGPGLQPAVRPLLPPTADRAVTSRGRRQPATVADAPAQIRRTGRLVGLPPPAQLPPGIHDFAGRRDAVAHLRGVLTAPRGAAPTVALVTGMGGVGKTALTLHVAHAVKDAFPDGQLYADLRSGDRDPAEPGGVLASFLCALGMPADAIPESIDARAALFRTLVDGLRLLVVLDNALKAAQVVALIPGSSQCAVLLTSRRRLSGLPVSDHVGLEPFEPAEALELLDRAAGGRRVAAEPAAALKLVKACGRLPLAVRIMGARLAARPGWSVGHLALRLADGRQRLNELRADDLTIEAAFELSYWQLSVEQARAFRLLATVDCPDLALPAAAALLGLDVRPAEDVLESLTDVALLNSAEPMRYGYHDLVRAFARQHAEATDDAGSRAHAHTRLIDFLLATACNAFQRAVPNDQIGDALQPGRDSDSPRLDQDVTAVPGLVFADLAAARSWVVRETENVIVLCAQTAADPATAHPGPDRRARTATDLLIALSPFGLGTRHQQLAATVCALAAAAVRRADQRAEGRALFLGSNLALADTRLDEAAALAGRAVEVCRASGDAVILRQALNDLGLIAQFQHRFEEAAARYDEALALARALGHRSGETATLLNAALAKARSGDGSTALAACEQVLAGCDPGNAESLGYALYTAGVALQVLGRHQEALDRFATCLELCRSTGMRRREVHARCQLAETLRTLGRTAEAVAEAEVALARCEEGDSARDRGNALATLGRTLVAHGRTEAAWNHLDQAKRLFARARLPEGVEVQRLLAALGTGLLWTAEPGAADILRLPGSAG